MPESKPSYEELEARIAELQREISLFRQDEAGNPDSVELSCKDSSQITRLLESEAQFRALVERTSDWIWEVDAQGVYRYASPKVKDLLGYEPCEIIGKKPFDLMPPEESLRVASVIGPIMSAAEPFSGLENLNRHKNGSLVHLETNGVPILDADGSVLGYRGIDRDITRRKHIEEQLRQALERVRLHVENSPMAVVEWGPDFRISSWNKEAEHIFGWSGEEVLGRRIDELRWVFEEDVAQVERISEGLISGTQRSSISVNRNYRKDGSLIICEWYNSSLLDSSGTLISILSLVLDVTERQRSEEALKESEKRLRLAVDTASLAIWEWNLEDNSVRLDDTCGSVFGDPVETEISYQWWVDRIHPEDRNEVTAAMDKAIASDVNFLALEYRFHRNNESWVRIFDRAHFFRDSSGELRRMLGAAMDITSLRQAEEELREARDELEVRVEERTSQLSLTIDALHDEVTQRIEAEHALRKRSEELRRLAGELTRAEQKERQRVSQILHDGLQQLLVGAKFRMSLMDLEQGDVPDNLTAVKETAALLDESIQITRSLTADLSPPVLRSGLTSALRWLVRRVRHTYGLEVELQVDEHANPVSDEVKTLLFQAARELLLNIIKHAGVKEARVLLAPANVGYQLVVADSGVGFDSEQLRPDGNVLAGTGLFSIRERLSYLGGRLEIETAPGRGARFSLYVPAEPQDAAAG